MYRIVNITDREGNVKEEFINKLKIIHPELVGKILNKDIFKTKTWDLFMTCLKFEWTDNTHKMLVTSIVTDYVEYGDKIMVTTMNSIYTFKKENN